MNAGAIEYTRCWNAYILLLQGEILIKILMRIIGDLDLIIINLHPITWSGIPWAMRGSLHCNAPF